VPSDWIERELWIGWDAPRNYVAGEASYKKVLTKIAGPVCEDGYLIPTAVRFVREPGNRYDVNAFRAEVDGQLIGYLRRHLAAKLAPSLDRARCSTFTVPGIIRGGSTGAPNLGCHIWLERRLGPGPEIALGDDPEFDVVWPPH
jgi:hypothetical protein